jgi:tetratricopeptide (TPR) repeat protein
MLTSVRMTNDEIRMTKEARRPKLESVPCKFVIRASSLFLVVLAFGSMPLLAHDSPEHEVEFLTTRMARVGKNASLLMRRAAEYKALGELEKAAVDLTEAIALEPKGPAAYADLSRVQFAQEKFPEACTNVSRAVTLTEDAGQRGPLYLLRAHIQAARGLATEALADCELSARRDDQDWYLIRSQLQGKLGRHEAQVAGLKEGFERNGSIVLEIEWVEAMIDAGQYRQALERIEQHLNRLRWRSSWLLRRARALKGMKMDYQADAMAALSELNQRIKPEHPEPTLLLDRALAYALLSKPAEAAKDLALAKKHGIPPTSCARVEALLRPTVAASIR